MRKDTTKYMRDVLYVPKLAGNMFSVRAAAQKELVLSFSHKYCWMRNKKRQLVGIGTTKGKLSCEVCYPPRESAQTAQERNRELQLWHQRLAHVNYQQLRQLENSAVGITLPHDAEKKFCEACVQGKMHQAPHKPLKEIRSIERLQLVHTDVCGPMQTKSIGRNRYFITFTDDYSRCCKVYFMKEKSEALEKFKKFKAEFEKESGQSNKALRADRGGEYLSDEFSSFLKSNGIRAEFMAAYTPQQNGVAERMNRTLVEAA